MDLGPYEILDELGRGGMGRVFVARHRPTGARRALKALDGVPDVEQLDRFRREVEALARVSGAGVVPIHDSGVAGGTLWYAMEIMPGGSLKARLDASGRLPWRQAVAIVAAVAHALGRCHATGLVHRDVKPENILFDDQGGPRLADFGCVRFLDARALTVTGTFMGTPGYMSPEQLNGERVGPATDVFALGVVLYELVQGAKPFTGKSVFELLKATSTGRLAAPLDAPPAVQQVVARALAPTAAGRTPDGAHLAAELDRLLAGKATPGSGLLRVAGVALALVAAGALAFALTRAHEEPKPAPRGGGSVAPSASPAVTRPRSLDARIAAWKQKNARIAASELADALRDFPGAGEELAAAAFALGVAGPELSPEVRRAFAGKGRLSGAVKAVETIRAELALEDGAGRLRDVLCPELAPDVKPSPPLVAAWRMLFAGDEQLRKSYPALVAPVFSALETFAIHDAENCTLRKGIDASPALSVVKTDLFASLDPGALPPVLHGLLACAIVVGENDSLGRQAKIDAILAGALALDERERPRLVGLLLATGAHAAAATSCWTPEIRVLARKASRLTVASAELEPDLNQRHLLAEVAYWALFDASYTLHDAEAIVDLHDAFLLAHRESLLGEAGLANETEAACVLVEALVNARQWARVDELLPDPSLSVRAAVLAAKACGFAEAGDAARAQASYGEALALRQGQKPSRFYDSLLETVRQYLSSRR